MRYGWISFIALLLGFPSFADGNLTRQYKNQTYHIQFDYPPVWEIMPCDKDDTCTLKIQDKKIDKSDYIVYIRIANTTFEQAIKSSILLYKGANGAWFRGGRFGECPAEELSLAAGKTVMGTCNCGVSDDLGFHAGAGECLTAVISNATRSITIDSNGQSSEVNKQLKALIPTIRFLQ